MRRPHGHDLRAQWSSRGFDEARPFFKLDLEPKRASFTRNTLHSNLASHGFHQLFGDSQAKTRAAVFACGRAIRLGETFEDQGLSFQGDANAGILNGELDLNIL